MHIVRRGSGACVRMRVRRDMVHAYRAQDSCRACGCRAQGQWCARVVLDSRRPFGCCAQMQY
eukprot:9487844-Lingulodinium_polyedra.AAC.1